MFSKALSNLEPLQLIKTAYVDRLSSVNVLAGPASGFHAIPAQTFMKVYYQHISTSSLRITDPTDDYIGQTITVHSKIATSFFMGLISSGSSLQGQHGQTFQSSVTVTTSNTHSFPANVIRTFMFLGSTANPRWIVLGC